METAVISRLAVRPMTDPDGDRGSSGHSGTDHKQSSARDPLAIRDLIAEHGPHVWRAVRSLGVQEADVDDVCQEVFVIVYHKLAEFERRSTLRSWIIGIALNVVRDFRKKAHRRREHLVDPFPQVAADADQERSVAERQAVHTLNRLLDALSEDQRRVFVLFEIEQMSIREIATLLDCPLQTAYSRLDVAREIVKRRMAAWQRREQPP